MSTRDGWGSLMALAVIVLPLCMAWVLLAWSERKPNPGSASNPRRSR